MESQEEDVVGIFGFNSDSLSSITVTECFCVPGTWWIPRPQGALSKSSWLEVEEGGQEWRGTFRKQIITGQCPDYNIV